MIIQIPKCEACGKPGRHRPEYECVLCDTHAEIPSYSEASKDVALLKKASSA